MPRHRLTWLIALALVTALLPAAGTHAELAQQPKHLFILSGQSNMRKPLPQSFTACVEQVLGKDSVIVVTVAHPSQPIRMWYKDWAPPQGMEAKPVKNEQGHIYKNLIKAVQKKTAGNEIASVTFIWMQGEADAKAGWGSVYEKSFYGVIEQLKQDLSRDDINFVVGRINDYWLPSNDTPDGDVVRAIQKKLGEDNTNGDWVNTDDLNRGVNPWGGYSFDDGHFPPAGYQVMGQRFAYKACKLINPTIKLDESLFTEAFIDSAKDIDTHAGIGKPITGAKPTTAPNDGDGLALLLDGKFGSLDYKHAQWADFAPSDKPIELIVDLGESQPIESVAVNTLISSEASAQFPDKIVISTSEDGKTFQINNSRYNTIKFYNAKVLRQMRSEGIEPQALLLLTSQSQKVARYIKVEITTGKEHVYIDEIAINAKKKP